MSRKELTQTYVLYDSHERVWSQFDRQDGLIGGNVAHTPGDRPEKRLVEKTERELTPVSKFPVAVVFDNRMIESTENSESAEQRHVYSVPLFSYQVVQQLEGRLLDYIDATCAEKEQREAQKRVVRKILWGYYEELQNARKLAYENSEQVS